MQSKRNIIMCIWSLAMWLSYRILKMYIWQ